MKISIACIFISAVFVFFQNCSQQKVEFSSDNSSLNTFVTGDLASCPSCLQPKALSAGSSHICAVANEVGYCWGSNLMGQLGNGTEINSLQPVPVLGLESGVQAMGSSYAGHQCAIVHNSAKCWGSNIAGQVGNGYVSTKVAVPVAVVGAESGVQAISSGGTFTCMIQNGKVKCWGATPAHWNVRQNGPYVYTTTPNMVQFDVDAKALSTGMYHACVLLTNNDVWCWGDNYFGQLGNGTYAHSFTPVKVVGLNGAEIKTMVSVNDRTCALLKSGRVKCWGADNGVFTATPTERAGISSAIDLSMGQLHSCAILNNGKKQCWMVGGNAASATSSFYEVVSTTVVSCALTSRSNVDCWLQGENFYGSYGSGPLNSSIQVNYN